MLRYWSIRELALFQASLSEKRINISLIFLHAILLVQCCSYSIINLRRWFTRIHEFRDFRPSFLGDLFKLIGALRKKTDYLYSRCRHHSTYELLEPYTVIPQIVYMYKMGLAFPKLHVANTQHYSCSSVQVNCINLNDISKLRFLLKS